MANPVEWKWCRLYNDLPEDKKLARIARAADVQRVIVLGMWTGLLAIANASPERGTLMLTEDLPYMNEELADMIGIDLAQFEKILNLMIRMDMVILDGECLVILNFSKRNPDSDSSTERVRRHRAKKKAEKEAAAGDAETGDNVPWERYGNVTETPQEEESESESEKEEESDSESEADEDSAAALNSAALFLQTEFEQAANRTRPQNGWPDADIFVQLAAQDVTREDVGDAVRWLRKHKRRCDDPTDILGSALTSKNKRLSQNRSRPRAPVVQTQSDWEKYLGGSMGQFVEQ